jgi:hypothetical protein
MIKLGFKFLPSQGILLGASLDHGNFTDIEGNTKPFNRLTLGFVFFNIQVFYFM